MWFTIPIKERRQRPLIERLFERRTGGGDDARVTRYLSELGEDKVRSLLSQGSLVSRRSLARRWLKSLQPEDRRSRLRALTVFTSATAAVAVAAFFTLNGPSATDAGEMATAEAPAEAPVVKAAPEAPPADEMEVAALASIAPAAGPAPEPAVEPEPAAETQTAAETEPEPAVQPEPELAAKPEPVAKPEPTVQPEPELAARPQPSAPIPASRPTPPPGGLYYVIGSFRHESNARKYSVMQAALNPKVVIGTANNGLRHYRVLVGPVSAERRLSLRRRIAAAGIANAWFLRH